MKLNTKERDEDMNNDFVRIREKALYQRRGELYYSLW